jgi:uncharacterized surface protein with fasciclin (FAS1) repeats
MKINRKYGNITVLYFFFALLFSLLSCNKGDDGDVLFTGDDYQNMMQYIDANRDFTSFNKIVNAGKMTDVLSAYNSNGGVDYTLFLPTNQAVTKFISESDRYSTLDALVQDAAYCAEIVRYHLVNGRIPSNEFPNGALANKTISNYYLTIFFREENDIVTYAVNDESKVLITDIALNNGTIHTIDKMLTPVVFTSYEWVEQSSGFTIFAELLSKCGLADTLNAFVLDELGREVYNEYTLFAESDLLYQANGIMSFDDLIKAVDPSGSANQDFTSPANAVNKYARYHILEKSVFLDEFATEVYNTYGDLPVSVDLVDILKINTGTKVFETIINGGDTIRVNYLQVNLEISNIVTRSGAIHQLDHLLYPFLPGRKTVTYQFYEEPVINALRTVEGNHTISVDDLEYISLIGTKSLTYIKSPTSISGNSNADYIEVSGDVDFSFKTPKILAGRYTLKIVLQRGYSYLASVQAYVDDTKVGVVIDPTINSAVFSTFTLGTVEFSDFSSHAVKLSTVIPGRMLIDRIIFEPI